MNILTKSAKSSLKNQDTKNINDLAETALCAAKHTLNNIKYKGNKSKGNIPRIIPVRKVGGILPLIPIFAGLSALGSLMGGSAAVLNTKNAKKQLKESERHNKAIELKIQKQNGKGLYLKPYKSG